MEPIELPATMAQPEWVNDWDLLSPRFQSEVTAYLQIVGVIVAVFLLAKRGRVFNGTTLFGGAAVQTSPSMTTDAKEQP
jgi:hypothetical protein